MRCYNCGCELSEHSFCTNCGVDVSLYKKIIRTSNYFYNQGLERAKVRDLSGAIVSLRQSLKFNKNNIKARNLLGLVYFEMGEMPAALSEWVISKNLKSKKNVAVDYIEMLQSNSARLDALNEAIKKYNKALEACKNGDAIDLATIQLKQVIKAYPNFIRAHQLLGLCYLNIKRPDLAKKEMERCKAIDVNNTLTLRYLAEAEKMLNPVDDKKKGKAKEEGTLTTSYMADGELIIQPVAIKEKRGSNAVLNIILGIAIGFAICFFLVLPSRLQQERSEAQESVKSMGTQLDAKNLTITELETENSEQADKIKTLTESLNKYQGTEGTLLSMENLLKAAAVYLETPENYLEVADYIKEIDESAFNEDTSENYKRLYYAIKSAIGASVCENYYNEGVQFYKAEQYEDAIAYLEAAVFFVDNHKESLYYLGLSYQATGNTDDAKTAYNKVIELYEGTWYANKSEQALKKMEAN